MGSMTASGRPVWASDRLHVVAGHRRRGHNRYASRARGPIGHPERVVADRTGRSRDPAEGAAGAAPGLTRRRPVPSPTDPCNRSSARAAALNCASTARRSPASGTASPRGRQPQPDLSVASERGWKVASGQAARHRPQPIDTDDRRERVVDIGRQRPHRDLDQRMERELDRLAGSALVAPRGRSIQLAHQGFSEAPMPRRGVSATAALCSGARWPRRSTRIVSCPVPRGHTSAGRRAAASAVMISRSQRHRGCDRGRRGASQV